MLAFPFADAIHVKRRPALVILDTGNDDVVYVAECPVIPGCMTQGRTLDEALDNIREAVELCLEVRGENAEENR